jgi:hypothetical protein
MAYNTILLGGKPEIEEFTAAGAITPGMQVTLGSGGTITAGPSAGANGMPWFALENSADGKGIADAYASGDRVPVAKCKGGEKIYAYLLNAEGALAIGDFVEVGGSGYVRKLDADASVGLVAGAAFLGVVREAADSTSAAVRIPIEIR